MELPEGLTQRPLAISDAAAVTAVMAAQELFDIGEVVIEEADIVSDWQRPSFDVSSSTVGVFDGDTLVAYAEVSGADRGDAAVHPDHRGRGIGTQLAQWMQACARGKGCSVIGMPVPSGSPGEELLKSLDYETRWTSWVLQLPEGRRIEEQPLPGVFKIRPAVGESDRRAAYAVLEDAFLEWSVRDRQSWEDFSAQVFDRPGFEPWNLRVVVDGVGEVAGACYIQLNDLQVKDGQPRGRCGYIDRIAVRKNRRGRGLARALLADAFTIARDHGATTSELSTDSRTGALGLYEKVGMQVTSTWVNLGKRL